MHDLHEWSYHTPKISIRHDFQDFFVYGAIKVLKPVGKKDVVPVLSTGTIIISIPAISIWVPVLELEVAGKKIFLRTRTRTRTRNGTLKKIYQVATGINTGTKKWMKNVFLKWQ